MKYTLATGEPIYVLYGHTGTSWIDNSTGVDTRSFSFDVLYTMQWNNGDQINASTIVGRTAPFYLNGHVSNHLHVGVFKPTRSCNNNTDYCTPPSTNWGSSDIHLPTGDYVDPEEFFTKPAYLLLAPPTPPHTSPWPSTRHDPALTARASVLGPQLNNGNPPTVTMVYDPVDYPSMGPVTGPNGTIYISSNTTLHAVTPNPSGNWKWPISPASQSASDIAVGADNTVYLVTREALYAVANRTQKWKYDLTGQGPKYVNVDPYGLIYVTGGDSSVSQSVTALDKDGNPQWTFGDFPVTYRPVVDSSGTVYIISMQSTWGSLYGALVAIGRDKSPKWACYSWQGCQDLVGVPMAVVMGADEKLYVITHVPYTATFLCVFDTNNGTLLDRRLIAGWDVGGTSSLAYSPSGGIYLTLYGTGTTLRRIVPSPWFAEDLFYAWTIGAPILDNLDNTYFVTYDPITGARIVCLRGDKQIVWSVPIVSSNIQNLIIGDQGALYFIGNDFKLYAVR